MNINVNDLTIGQAKQLAAFLGNAANSDTLATEYIGKTVIIRTYSAGVWFGVLNQKSGNEVILKDARRMWQWFAAESISLSGVAVHGIERSKSKIAPAVDAVWLEAIEIIPVSGDAAESIAGAKDAEAN